MIGRTVSHYRIVEKLGGGGMGVVYKAEDTKLGRPVALKFLPEELSKDRRAVERFQREARAASALNHPNICTIHDVDEYQGQQFIVMELLQGQTLKHRLAGGSLDAEHVAKLGLQVAEALEAAHAKGIIHRDIKPANIFVSDRDQVKLLDFGLAKLVPPDDEATVTQSFADTGCVAGTLPYMSPEQLRGSAVDPRADIYAVGVVLYEMSTGQRPFRDSATAQLIASILQDPPPPPGRFRSEIPARMEEIILKCLEKDAEKRYQSAKELAVDLRRVSAPSASVPMPGRGRYRLGPIGAVATLLAVLAAVAVPEFGPIRARLFGGKYRINAIAVLPLKNLMADPQQDYFVEGMQEALITELSQVGALKVISRPSTLRYRESDKAAPQIARELRVDTLVEGSVMREGDRVRISVQLIEGATDKNLWAQSFDRELRGILDLQSEVAREVTQKIKIAVTPAEAARLAQSRPVDPESYQLYLRGRYFWYQRTEEGLKKALEYFNQAVEKDPGYAPPYAGLAYTYEAMSQELYEVQSPQEANPNIMAALRKALELDESLAEAHAVLAYVKLRREWDWAGAEKEFKRALALNPSFVASHFWYSHYLLPLGRKEESLTESRRALELDPFSLIANTHLGWNYLYLRQYSKAAEQLRKTLELDQNFALAHMFLGQTYEQERMYPQAVAELSLAAGVSGGAAVYTASLGHAYGVSGDTASATKVLLSLKDMAKRHYVPSYEIAVVYIGLGDKEQALHWLERAYETRDSGWLVDVNVDPRFDPLHSDARFQALLRRMNLPVNF